MTGCIVGVVVLYLIIYYILEPLHLDIHPFSNTFAKQGHRGARWAKAELMTCELKWFKQLTILICFSYKLVSKIIEYCAVTVLATIAKLKTLCG